MGSELDVNYKFVNHAVTNLLGFDPSKKNEYDYKGILKNSKRTIAD